MNSLATIRLPWNYWVYCLLAVLGFIFPFIWYALIWSDLFVDSMRILFLLSGPLLMGIVVIYTTFRLGQGVIPSVIQIGWSKRRPPGNLHRFLLGIILWGSSMSFSFGPYHFGFDLVYIIIIVCMISGIVLFSSGATSIPSGSESN